MNRFLRLSAPVAALGLIIGCAGEDGAGVTPPSGPTNAPIPAPESPTPPPAVDAEAPDLTPPAEPKVGTQAQTPDLTPAEVHKAEEANHPEGAEAKPGDEAKKDDAPLTPPQAEEPKAEAKKDEAPKADAKKDEAKAEAAAPSLEGPGAAAAALSDEEIAEIKKLPAEDHELALAQAVCPVSDENLGSMDVPLKVSAEGRDFFICCKGCEKKVKSDPKGVLAKLDGEKK